MNRYLIPVAAFALLVVMFRVGLDRDPTFVPSPLIGRPAPTFDLPRLGDPGQRVSNADLRGRVSLVNVWATWCSGCRQEHETLNRIAAFGDVPIYGLNWKDDRELARQWLDRLGNPYVATGFDGDGRVAIDWGVYGAPETFLIDAEGVVLYRHISPLSMDIWENEFLPRIEAARESS
ncbi:MAG: DsbE family thiol:disulfide interchange protein [Gammaproteobacteria bacterium]